MNKSLLFIASFLTAIFLVSIASATDYGYSKSYIVKETYDNYGYTYYQKATDKTPWGETTSYRKVKDYETKPVFFIYNRDPYKNKVSDYWNYGPYHGYLGTYKTYNKYNTQNTYNSYAYNNRNYLDYQYDDSYVRAKTGSQYYNYYYEPIKVYSSGGAMYWDHGYNGYDCDQGYYCWKN